MADSHNTPYKDRHKESAGPGIHTQIARNSAMQEAETKTHRESVPYGSGDPEQ